MLCGTIGIILVWNRRRFESSTPQPEQGIYPSVTYDSDLLGSVNLIKGSLAIDSSLLTLPHEEGFNIGQLRFHYNSPVYYMTYSYDDSGNIVGSNGNRPEVGLVQYQSSWEVLQNGMRPRSLTVTVILQRGSGKLHWKMEPPMRWCPAARALLLLMVLISNLTVQQQP